MYSANHKQLATQLGVQGILSNRKPRRLITRSGLRVRGIYPSSRFPDELTWETPQERRLIRIAEISRAILQFHTQPFALTIRPVDAPSFAYTPDGAALVRRPSDGKTLPVVVECKPASLANSPEFQIQHAHVRAVLAKLDVRFVVLTEEELPDALDANFNLVLRHARFRRRTEDRPLLEARVRDGAFTDFGSLVETVGMADALHTLASGWLQFDHFAPLTIQSALSNELKEAWDAARHIYA